MANPKVRTALLDTIKALIVASGKQQKAIANDLGMSKSCFSRLMSGKHRIDFETAVYIFGYFGKKIAIEDI